MDEQTLLEGIKSINRSWPPADVPRRTYALEARWAVPYIPPAAQRAAETIIIETVTDGFDIKPADILRGGKCSKIESAALMCAAWAMRKYGYTFPKIAGILQRHDTTILHHTRRFDAASPDIRRIGLRALENVYSAHAGSTRVNRQRVAGYNLVRAALRHEADRFETFSTRGDFMQDVEQAFIALLAAYGFTPAEVARLRRLPVDLLRDRLARHHSQMHGAAHTLAARTINKIEANRRRIAAREKRGGAA